MKYVCLIVAMKLRQTISADILFMIQFPGTNHVEMLKSFLVEGLEIDHTCIPYRSKSDFIGEAVRVATLNTWSIGAVSATNFYAKHHVGRPRPEVRFLLP